MYVSSSGTYMGWYNTEEESNEKSSSQEVYKNIKY